MRGNTAELTHNTGTDELKITEAKSQKIDQQNGGSGWKWCELACNGVKEENQALCGVALQKFSIFWLSFPVSVREAESNKLARASVEITVCGWQRRRKGEKKKW